MKLIQFPDGTQVPALGQGTWMMAEDHTQRAEELQALRTGIDLGLTLLDTAEMECLPPSATTRLRSQPSAAGHQLPRPISIALARARAAGRNGRSDGTPGGGGKD